MTKILKVLHLPTGLSITMYDIDTVSAGSRSIMINFCRPWADEHQQRETCSIFSINQDCKQCLLSRGYYDFDLVKDQFLIEESDDGN